MTGDRPDDAADAREVLDAALHAWQIHGETCHVESAADRVPGLFASLAALESRCIEFVIDHEVGAEAWGALSRWPRSDSWRLRALVPQSLLGQAHEYLREGDFELQGWWVENGRVFFRSVEIA